MNPSMFGGAVPHVGTPERVPPDFRSIMADTQLATLGSCLTEH